MATRNSGHAPMALDKYYTDPVTIPRDLAPRSGSDAMVSYRLPESHCFAHLRRNHYGVILADPPWRFEVWNGEKAVKRRAGRGTNVAAAVHYQTMAAQELAALAVADLAAEHCALFMWVTWPVLPQAMRLIGEWGFTYKTCAFAWTKAHAGQIELFSDELTGQMGMGYWTRANTEPCLLATRGKPRRLHADVRQSIISPRREHSRKPDCVHGRIERLVAGPYLELFARRSRPGWDSFGDQKTKFDGVAG
jgi:N6-adenosine-specific RNA methylase IME4